MSLKKSIQSALAALEGLPPDTRAALDCHFNLIDRIAWFTKENESYEIYSPEKPICDKLLKLGILIKKNDEYAVPLRIHHILEYYAPS